MYQLKGLSPHAQGYSSNDYSSGDQVVYSILDHFLTQQNHQLLSQFQNTSHQYLTTSQFPRLQGEKYICSLVMHELTSHSAFHQLGFHSRHALNKFLLPESMTG